MRIIYELFGAGPRNYCDDCRDVWAIQASTFYEAVPSRPAPTSSWAVTVERNGESVVTLSSGMLAGRDLSDEDERVIRSAAEHLLAFVGSKGRL